MLLWLKCKRYKIMKKTKKNKKKEEKKENRSGPRQSVRPNRGGPTMKPESVPVSSLSP
jgi:hypothetical protein